MLFLWHKNPRPSPPLGAAASPQDLAAGDKTIKRACGASTGLQPGGRSPYNKMKIDAKRRAPFSAPSCKKAQANKTPVLFLWHKNPRPSPPLGAAASPQDLAAGDKTIKRACGASTGLQPGGRSPYNKMKIDAKRRAPFSAPSCKKAQANKTPVLFLWHENPRPRPPLGAVKIRANERRGQTFLDKIKVKPNLWKLKNLKTTSPNSSKENPPHLCRHHLR